MATGHDDTRPADVAIDNTIASARLEGIEPTTYDLELMQRVASGELTTEQAIAIALRPAASA